MDRNKVEIQLLQNDPERLLLEYQGMIWAIVRKQHAKGLVKFSDQDDLFQEINKKLLERMHRIQKQFNNSSQLRTYFSRIIKNICLENIRKINLVMEPQADPYGKNELSEEPIDVFLIQQEYERFNRVITMKAKHGKKLLLLIKVMNDLPIFWSDISSFSYKFTDEDIEKTISTLEGCKGRMKKDKLAIFAEILYLLEGKVIPSDSLRKWYSTHLEDCLYLMNGNPPRSSYNAESLGLLLEKVLHEKNG